MGKKLQKDFKERQRARIEKETLQSNGSIEPEESKLKHNDDYRGKIVHDKDRFQDKVHEKVSKRNAETERNGKTSKRNARYRSSETGSISQEEIGKTDYGTEVKDVKIYDPLGKDLDNDGIIDRYDNDFRDSDYFESTYDVEDNLHHNAEDRNSFSKSQKSQKKNYKRKNYSDKLYSRKKDKEAKDEKVDNKKSGKEAILDREKKNRLSKEQETIFENKTSKVSALSGLAKGSETVRDYLSHGSDENQGVESGEKIADTSSKLIQGIKNYSDKKRAKKDMTLQIRTIKSESENPN
ncbi:NlpC/P60 family protein [Streptococcus anginosus]|uniref:NlpC/P60 family protein n=1 Tax=Streptococcus anginosus TaxID=1328 RepID=A0A4U9ZBQ7_STRAP|nr:NlpC/P60 family protein [Streptococcus milleri]VTS37903.1 NlpC/P60 family protein [Streptococcus anginosus]